MDCRDIQKLLSAYCDNEIKGHEKESIEEHLAECTACSGELEQMQRLISMVGKLEPVSPPPAFRVGLRSRIEEEVTRPARRWWSLRRALAGALVLVFLAVLAINSFKAPSNEPVPMVQERTFSITSMEEQKMDQWEVQIEEPVEEKETSKLLALVVLGSAILVFTIISKFFTSPGRK